MEQEGPSRVQPSEPVGLPLALGSCSTGRVPALVMFFGESHHLQWNFSFELNICRLTRRILKSSPPPQKKSRLWRTLSSPI